MDLSELRTQIDAIDEELVKLFCARMEVSARVADYKKANNLPIYVPAREREILQDVAKKAGPEMANYTRVLYSMLFELSRSYQSKRNRGDPQKPVYTAVFYIAHRRSHRPDTGGKLIGAKGHVHGKSCQKIGG